MFGFFFLIVCFFKYILINGVSLYIHVLVKGTGRDSSSVWNKYSGFKARHYSVLESDVTIPCQDIRNQRNERIDA